MVSKFSGKGHFINNILRNLAEETPEKLKVKFQEVFANFNTAYCENEIGRSIRKQKAVKKDQTIKQQSVDSLTEFWKKQSKFCRTYFV